MDMSASEKYIKNRGLIENGDLVLYKGTGIMSKLIQYFDSAYFSHIGVIWKYNDTEDDYRLITLDMWSNGLSVVPLSQRMIGYSDFCILRPKIICDEVKKHAIYESLKLWEDVIKYNFLELLRIAIVKKTGIDITGLSENKRLICSGFAQDYCSLIGIDTYKNLELITPQDFIRHMDSNF